MRRKSNIEDAFIGASGAHEDIIDFFDLPDFEITAIRSVLENINDIYVDYSYLSGTTISGTTSIFQPL